MARAGYHVLGQAIEKVDGMMIGDKTVQARARHATNWLASFEGQLELGPRKTQMCFALGLASYTGTALTFVVSERACVRACVRVCL